MHKTTIVLGTCHGRGSGAGGLWGNANVKEPTYEGGGNFKLQIRGRKLERSAPKGRWGFACARTISVFSGGGNLTTQDGKLVAEDANGRATFTFYEEGGKRMLGVVSREKGGEVPG